jgi:hypothetical protein
MPLLRPFHDFDYDGDAVDGGLSEPSPIHFDGLAKSAFDFFRKAFSEVSTDPKYSTIHFYTGVELLFKARLLHEHWTLVVAKPELATLSHFKSGHFRSVTLEDAIQRLENIAEERMSKEERGCLAKVGNHRNQIIHFFHEGYVGDKPDPAIVSEVVAEQFRAWVYVQRRLENQWSDHFSAHADSIRQLNDTIQKNRQFLAAKFKLIEPEIEKHRSNGSEIIRCDSCGMEAAVVDSWKPPARIANCLVCHRENASIAMECPECKELVFFDEGEGTCQKCGNELGLDDLVDEFTPSCDLSDGEEPDSAYCSECERTEHHTVVPCSQGYICLVCTATYERISYCGWCSERVAGDLEGSYLTGCLMCEGSFGHDKD